MLANRSKVVSLLVAGFVAAAGIIVTVRCSSGGAVPVLGLATSNNQPPTLDITAPVEDQSVAQGERFLLGWNDTDPDNNALISFSLIDTVSAVEIPLVTSIQENDSTGGVDSFSVSTGLIPRSSYFIRGVIFDGINPPVTAFATTPAPANRSVTLIVTDPGQAPPTTPPQVVVIDPGFNLSVSQDDTLNITIQPTPAEPNPGAPDAMPPVPATPAYDPDSDVTLYILLDVDSNPNNDDPSTDVPGISDGVIVLRQQMILEDEFGQLQFPIQIDLTTVPARADGSPYFVRATLDDQTNVRRHEYAAGTVSVVESAQGNVDMATIGKTRSGVRWQGFNPGSLLGSKMISARDFDDDGIDDLLLVAQKGNPGNRGNLGEAYLIYGMDKIRFGGQIDVNSTSTAVDGVIFGGPPVRQNLLATATARSDGITDVATIEDLNGDGRSEILFGLAHCDGIFNGRDDDIANNPPAAGGTTTAIVLVLREGEASLQVGTNNPMLSSYIGVEDGYIDSVAPNAVFGIGDLEYVGPPNRKWVLIKFKDVLDKIPDPPAQIQNVTARVRFNISNPGDSGMLFQACNEYNESMTTFAGPNAYADNGGEPVLGADCDTPGVDYVPILGQNGGVAVGGMPVGEVTVDVSGIVNELIARQLGEFDDELRFIIVPGMMGDNVVMRSSEYNAIETDRPRLTINYNRINFGGGSGCYPDPFVNNLASQDMPETFPGDDVVEALGVTTILHSNNRDIASATGVNLDRLNRTVVWIELIGQEPAGGGGLFEPLGEGIFQLAQGRDPGVIEGARIQSGWYDWWDHLLLNQPPINDQWGYNVGSLGDINNDQLEEIIISAPRNERDYADTLNTFGAGATHAMSRAYLGSLAILPGRDYSTAAWSDLNGQNASIPFHCCPINAGSCGAPGMSRGGPFRPADDFEVFAENMDDWLAGGQSAGDFNLDGVPDILCSAKFNDRGGLVDSGAVYVIYGRVPTGDFRLAFADTPGQRPPMLRIRGDKAGDQLGYSVATGFDVNGDQVSDVFIGAPAADFGSIPRPDCGGNVIAAGLTLTLESFDGCRDSFGEEVFDDDVCKAFDFNNDRQIDDDDATVLTCLMTGTSSTCCPVDNGFVGVVFGGTMLDGDRVMSQLGTADLPGIRFVGTHAGDRAGHSISSAGDFNNDGFGDLLIAAPGELRVDNNLRTRKGVAYLIFGGTHLTQSEYRLDRVGTDDLPGIVFTSPFVSGRPNEAPVDSVGVVGDINNDGFSDIGLGCTKADFVDSVLPQDPNNPGTDPGIGRRPNGGDAYIVYGNNIGSNRVR